MKSAIRVALVSFVHFDLDTVSQAGSQSPKPATLTGTAPASPHPPWDSGGRASDIHCAVDSVDDTRAFIYLPSLCLALTPKRKEGREREFVWYYVCKKSKVTAGL